MSKKIHRMKKSYSSFEEYVTDLKKHFVSCKHVKVTSNMRDVMYTLCGIIYTMHHAPLAFDTSAKLAKQAELEWSAFNDLTKWWQSSKTNIKNNLFED